MEKKEIPEGYEEYKRKALEPIVNYIESVMASYSKEELEARIKKALPQKESEDEKIRMWLVRLISTCRFNDIASDPCPGRGNVLDWLEKQKEQKPLSTEDEKDFLEKEVKAFLCNYDKEFDDDVPTYDIAEHFYQLGKNSQKPGEWSEEDKIHLNNAILEAKKEWGVNSYTARWLENLRDNYKKCNSHWKPSEEQMKAIDLAIRFVTDDFDEHPTLSETLRGLYNDLKKL